MESPVVILCEVDDLLDDELIEGCYVGMSRAQFVLAVVGLPGTIDRIRAIDVAPIAGSRERSEQRHVDRVRGAAKASAFLSEGALCLGRVTNITSFGVFVRLAGIERDGLIHRSRITGDRYLDLESLFQRGEDLSVRIESIDDALLRGRPRSPRPRPDLARARSTGQRDQ